MKWKKERYENNDSDLVAWREMRYAYYSNLES